MAKAKVGGTRAYIRGSIGSDVYAQGRDGKGKKQQVVRAKADEVKNPQTQAQMKQRMILTGVSNLTKVLRPFINHAFDNVPDGASDIAEFQRLALQAVRKDADLASPVFGYVRYGSKIVPNVAVPVSQGRAKFATTFYPVFNDEHAHSYGKGGYFAIIDQTLPDGQAYPDPTPLSDVINKVMGGSRDNYITVLNICVDNRTAPTQCKLFYQRYKVKDSLADDFELDNVGMQDVFDIEGNVSNLEDIQCGERSRKNCLLPFCPESSQMSGWYCICSACIFTKKTAKGWQHSTSYIDILSTTNMNDSGQDVAMETVPAWQVEADFATALATYPTGEERFLNGGEL